LEVDIRPVDPDFGTYTGLYIGKSDLINPRGGGAVTVSLLWTTKWYQEIGINWGTSGTIDTSKWYHIELTYNSNNSSANWKIIEKDTDIVFYEQLFTSVNINGFNQIALGFEDVPNYGSRKGTEIFVDNIKIALTDSSNNSASQPVPEPATLLLLGIGLTGMGSFCRRSKESNKVNRKIV